MMLGLLLGMRHALDADHVVAVATIVSRERSILGAARVGALWGLGHSATILAIGGALLTLRVGVPERVALAAELGVALMLVTLGVRSIRTASAPQPGSERSSFVVGIVHGVAGSAALTLLVLSAVPGTVAGFAYLGAFGIGTIAGMIGVTTAIGTPMLFAATRVAAAGRYLRLAAGVACAVFGLALAHDVGASLMRTME
jgi:high-affinity nickel-transport protein